jgi:ArsR family transcriptional regulator
LPKIREEKMSKTNVEKRLARLASSSVCPVDDVSKYAAELKQLAEKFASKVSAKNESEFFKALADENRIRILKLLMLRELCVCEVMVALGLTQPTTSHHLGILENAGLVKKRKEGKWVYYSVANPKIVEELKKLKLLK